MKYTHYIWDFDGTLFDTYPIILKGFMDTLNTYQIQADEKEIYYLLKSKSSKAIAEKYGLDFAEFTRVFKSFEAKDTREPVPFEGAKAILEKVIAEGGKNYILTHRDTPGTKELLATYELTDYFVEIIGSERPFPRKPAPDSLLYLIDTYKMEKSQAVMIGDRFMDIDAGKAAGINTVFFDQDHLLEDVSATQNVTHLLDID